MNTVIIIAAAVLLAALLYFEQSQDFRRVLPFKTTLSCLFIITALVQPHPLPRYFFFILIGLVFCLGGDVFLALKHEKAFLPVSYTHLRAHET